MTRRRLDRWRIPPRASHHHWEHACKSGGRAGIRFGYEWSDWGDIASSNDFTTGILSDESTRGDFGTEGFFVRGFWAVQKDGTKPKTDLDVFGVR